MSCVGVKGAGGFIAEQDLRVCRQGSCDGDSLLLTAGKLGRIGVRLVRKPYQLQKLHGALSGIRLWNARKLQREADILDTGTLSKKIEALEYHGDISANLSKLRLGKGPKVAAVDENAALGGAFQHIDTSHKGAFARAAHTDNAINIPISNCDGDIFECFYGIACPCECLRKIFNFYHFVRLPYDYLSASSVVCLPP